MAIYKNIHNKQLGVTKGAKQVVLKPGETIDLTPIDLVRTGFNRVYLKAAIEKAVEPVSVEVGVKAEELELVGVQVLTVEPQDAIVTQADNPVVDVVDAAGCEVAPAAEPSPGVDDCVEPDVTQEAAQDQAAGPESELESEPELESELAPEPQDADAGATGPSLGTAPAKPARSGKSKR